MSENRERSAAKIYTAPAGDWSEQCEDYSAELMKKSAEKTSLMCSFSLDFMCVLRFNEKMLPGLEQESTDEHLTTKTSYQYTSL